MAYNTAIKAAIDAAIYDNVSQDITGAILNGVLKAMVDAASEGFQFAGIAEPATNPGTPKGKIYYMAFEGGNYQYFGNNDLPDNHINFLFWTGSSWAVEYPVDLRGFLSENNTFSGNNTFSAELKVAFESLIDLNSDDNLQDMLNALMPRVLTAVENHIATFDAYGRAKDSGVSVDDLAKKDGISEKLVSGSARGILSPSAIEELFLFQRTANGAGGTGAAVFQSIKGNSIVWNQIFNQTNYAFSVTEGASYPQVGASVSAYNVIAGHKYFVNVKMSVTSGTLPTDLYFTWKQTGDFRITPNTAKIMEATESASIGAGTGSLRIYSGNASACAGQCYVTFIDLTLSTLSVTSVSDFTKFYNLPYYAPNPGAILNNCATGMVTKDADDNILDTLALPITTATGKLNGEGESVVISPNGLAGVGTSFDEAIVEKGMWTKTKKRRMRVDMGTLAWAFAEGVFFATISDMIGVDMNPNGICSKYTISANRYSSMPDKSYLLGDSTFSSTALNRIYVKDSDYATSTAFKAAMSGVMLDYPLATEQLYVLDTPVPVVARVDENGTQTILPQGVDESGTPMTAPFKASIQYPVKLGIAPIGQQSLVNLLETMKTAGKIASYTMVWDAATGVYDFTIS